jgi:hypothetical protein
MVNPFLRRRVRCEGLDYAVGLHCTATVWRLDSLGRRTGSPVAVGDLAIAIGRRGFRAPRTIGRRWLTA